MGRPRAGTHAVPTKERILDAAERRFGELGYEGAGLAEIAAEASIKRSSLLYHFGSKEALHEQVVRRLFNALKQAFAEAYLAAPNTRPEALVVRLVEVFLDFLEARPAWAPMVLRGIVDGQGPVRELFEQELVPLLDLIEQYVQPGAPEGVPVRSALLQIGSNAMLRASAGPLRETVWRDDATLALARRLLVR